MKKILLLSIGLLCSSSMMYASFDTIYNQFIDNLATMSSPSIVKTITDQSHALGSMTTLNAHLGTATQSDISASLTLKADGVISSTGMLLASGSLMIDGKGSLESMTGSLKANLDYLLNKDNMFLKLSALDIPFHDEEAKKMIALMSNKWLKINLSGATAFDTITLTGLQNIHNQKEIISSLKKDKILTSTQDGIWRNGYEVYPVTLNPLGFKHFFVKFAPNLGEVSDEEIIDSFKNDVVMYGVLGMKDNEVKMGMIVKEKRRSIFLPTSKTVLSYSNKNAEHTIGFSFKEGKQILVGATLTSKNTSTDTNTMALLVDAPEMNLKVDATTKYYDAGILELKEPTDAVDLEDVLESIQ